TAARSARPAHRGIPRAARALLAAALALAAALSLAACGGNAQGASSNAATGGTTSGAAFEQAAPALAPFDAAAAVNSNGALIDTSHTSEGYVAVSATSSARLKFEVAQGGVSYYYDLPGDGTPIACPLNMGDGSYTFCVWENTSGTRYAALSDQVPATVQLADEFQPFLRPNRFCDFDEASESTRLASQLVAGAQNEGDALRAICEWVCANVTYDEQKAASLVDATGYVPDPDATIASKSGICFDYASLTAAMLRSVGIPCKIVTGDVAPDGIYHAWNMVYIDGSWVAASFTVSENTWTRVDLTFAAGGSADFVGDGSSYTDRYVY
ncbi:transglutaminase-like domain-containing protein, partial [Adlercreutzia sp. ZJ176]|uniref:transglutaminase-like domain-containing protein n=2 Tax=unclassified Adlercreutzia TaxID=2636013 RepID=UPI0013EC7394